MLVTVPVGIAVSAASHHTGRRSLHAVAAASRRPVLEIGNIADCRTGADPVSVLKAYHADALRAVVTPKTYKLGVLKCARSAAAGGYRVHLVLQWWDRWKAGQIERYFNSVLQRAPSPWAVSIGNEQELHNHGSRKGITPTDYARIWRHIEPIVARLAPHAIRVAGEISPWHLAWIKHALGHGLPGVQAVAGHPYSFAHTFAPSGFAKWARRHHLPYWFDEGYRLRGVWERSYTRTAHALAGAAVLGAWLA